MYVENAVQNKKQIGRARWEYFQIYWYANAGQCIRRKKINIFQRIYRENIVQQSNRKPKSQ